MAIGEWGSWRGLVDLGIRQKSLTAGDGGHTGFADCRFAIGGIEAGMEGKGAELAKRLPTLRFGLFGFTVHCPRVMRRG